MSKPGRSLFILLIAFAAKVGAQSAFTTSIVSTSGSCDNAVLSVSTLSNVWESKANFSGGLMADATGFSIGDKGYVGTGYNGTYTNAFWEYDPATDSWSQKANFPSAPRSKSVGFSIGNKGYLGTGGGLTTPNYNDFWEYDPQINMWDQKAFFTGGPRINAIAFSIGNKGYLGTGTALINNTTVYYNDFWEYDPATDTWTQMANVGGPVRYKATGFSVNGNGYVGLGNNSTTYLNDFWEYTPATDTWLQKSAFPGGARENSIGLTIACKGYVGLGFDGQYHNDAWQYDPPTDTWVGIPNFPGAARSSSSGFSVLSKIYIGTGYNGNYQTDMWAYNPTVTYQWSTGATTPTVAVSTSGTYSVTVNLFNCVNATDSKQINVNQTPTLTVNSASMCAGTNTVLTVTSTPSTGVTYLWSPGNSTATSVTVSPNVNTTYTVTGNNSGCISNAVATVTVFPSSTAVTNFSYNSPVCKTASNPSPNMANGFTQNGVFSSSAGLSINPSTGVINLNASTAGSYVVTYSLSGNTCMAASSGTATIVINAPAPPNTNFSYSSPVCASELAAHPILSNGFSGGGSFSSSENLVINNSNGIVDLLSSPQGTFTINYNYTPIGCMLVGSGSTTLQILPSPSLTISPGTTIFAGESAALTATSSTGTYTWHPSASLSCSNCSSITVSPLESTEYCVETTDGTCSNSSCVVIVVEIPCSEDQNLSMPNAFSPNGDGHNDQYCIKGLESCFTNFSIAIYDRWGEKVFESNETNFCWDGTYHGKVMDPGVVVFSIKAQTSQGKPINKKGNITLLK